MTLKETITEDMKAAMKAHDKDRLSTIRLLLAAIKQKEVDERVTLDDAQVVSVVSKLMKQRADSVAQYRAANRADLADKEEAEIEVLKAYLPKQLSEAEIAALIDEALAATNASGMAGMGKVMGYLKPKLAGKADMGKVSAMIKAKLLG
ncbi:MAG TPA: glutamyl-tRNA amidotransferase [Sutterella sp.]|nr:glutamyl-tRNA amidotransferase [Sutterella sp.]